MEKNDYRNPVKADRFKNKRKKQKILILNNSICNEVWNEAQGEKKGPGNF